MALVSPGGRDHSIGGLGEHGFFDDSVASYGDQVIYHCDCDIKRVVLMKQDG